MNVFRATLAPAPQKRASKPKVRTGCARCKQRHIKCDEARPSCSACTRSSANCHYIILDRKKQTKCSKPVVLAPMITPAILCPARREHANLACVPRGLGFGPRTTAIEAAYFQQYQVISNLELAHPDLWNRTMLRESVRDECIRYGLIAIGALSKAIYGNPDPAVRRLSLAAPGFHDNTHYQAAGSYYSVALRLLRMRLAQGEITSNPRSVLMATFIFIGFENMLDNFGSVDALMSNGAYLLSSQHSHSRIPLSAAGHHVVDGGAIVPLYEVSSTYYALWIFRCIQMMENNIPINFKRFQDQQRVILSHLQHWESTVKRILDIETDSAKKRSLMLSLVGIKAMRVMILCFADPTLMAWDAHCSLFTETLNYVESAMAIPRSASGKNEEHIFDDSIVPTVDSFSLWCRDKELRWRTQRIREHLAQASHTSGPIPKEKTARVGIQVVVAVEEQGRDNKGFISADSRYSWTGAAWNDDRTELLITMTGTTLDVSSSNKVQRTVAYSPLTKLITSRQGWDAPFSCTFLGHEQAVQPRH